MRKLLYLFALSCSLLPVAGIAQNQPCWTDEHRAKVLAEHPELDKIEKEYNERLKKAIANIEHPRILSRSTSSVPDTFDIPIVVHIVHDFNATSLIADQSYLPDDSIFNAVKSWNAVYLKQNPDTSDVITPFKKYIGNPKIRLHLATIDPAGKPTKGITRRRSYLTINGSDEAKFDIWAPTSYVNIWVINRMRPIDHGNAAAYATPPSTAAVVPYYDGVLTLANYLDQDKTINHEIGHIFSLIHPWGGTNQAQCGTCADNGSDQVDDTPPTIGHWPDRCQYGAYTSRPGVAGCSPTFFPYGNIYDTICATNYYQVYVSASGRPDSLVDYPDTTNSQNIMDYTYCSKMFTKGQVVRMHAALTDSLAGRNNLYTPTNLSLTGALAPRPDLKPIPEYSVTNTQNRLQHFTCPGGTLRLWNRSWNDTVTKIFFNINSATTAVDSLTNPTYNSFFNKTFRTPGWASVTMTARGNRTGDSTITRSDIYVADSNATPVFNYFQEFAPGGDMAKWPMFNYYNNDFKWEPYNNGFYDGYSLKYNGYDARGFAFTGSVNGDFDDFYTVPFNLTSLSSGACNLNFFSSGASKSSNSNDMTDTLEISYSIDKGNTWTRLSIISKGNLCNKGAIATSYAPASMADWKAQTINVPAAARTAYTVFRFRYYPGVHTPVFASNYYPYSTGNNFYLDRIHFSQFPAEVSGAMLGSNGNNITIAPNPTSGNAFVVFANADNKEAKVVVTDITGKTVYTTTEVVSSASSRIEIPASVLSVKGMYLVQTIVGSETTTNKLVVY